MPRKSSRGGGGRDIVADRVDRISGLTDDILIRILSFLPVRDAARTVPIRRFGNLWRSINRLHFDINADFSFEELGFLNFINFMNNVLSLHLSPTLNEFLLVLRDESDDYFYCNLERRKMFNKLVRRCLAFAETRKVNFLQLSFSLELGVDDLYLLPRFFFNSGFLTKVNLYGCRIRSVDVVNNKLLRELNLQYVVLRRRMFEEILSGCPSLESLSIIACPCISKALVIKSSSLRSLKFISGMVDDYETDRFKVKIFCPSLTSLCISIDDYRTHLVLGCCPHIISAQVEVGVEHPFNPSEYDFIQGILQELWHAKVISLDGSIGLVFSAWEVRDIPTTSFSWKSLSFTTVLTGAFLPGTARILRSCDKLENLEINLTDTYFYDAEIEWERNVDEMNFWDSLESFSCLETCLTTVKICGSVEGSNVLNLVKFLLRNAIVLERLVFCSADMETFYQTSLSFPRASSDAVILFKP